MARKLQNQTNVTVPDSDFPNGRIKNDSGINDGTPVTENVYGDVHQFFAKMLRDAETEPLGNFVTNDLPDNTTNGFQLNEALALNAGFDFKGVTINPAQWVELDPVQTLREFDGVRIRGVIQIGNNSANQIASGIATEHRPTSDRIVPIHIYRPGTNTIELTAHVLITTFGTIVHPIANYASVLLDRFIFDGGYYKL